MMCYVAMYSAWGIYDTRTVSYAIGYSDMML